MSAVEADPRVEAQPIYDVTVGPVPCFAPVAAFGPYMDPVVWHRFVSGIRMEVLDREEGPRGWRGRVHETLGLYVPGAQRLNNVLDVHFQHGPEEARVEFSLVESREGVLTLDGGWIRAVPSRSGRGTRIYANKTLRLAPDAPQNRLAPIIPALVRAILWFWLGQYSLTFMLRQRLGRLEAR